MKANIVIMGQSGNGKSTIVNALMGEYVAKTGKGAAVTDKNQVYSTIYKIGEREFELNLYDTVGIELSEEVTQFTLNEIEEYIRKTEKTSGEDDITLVWFCINNRSSRFQDFEIELIRKLSYEYELPFIIVLTQCIDDSVGELERTIHFELPGIVTAHVLAEDYRLRGGAVIPAYGLDSLLELSVLSFDMLKTPILESKLNAIQEQLSISERQLNEYKKEAEGTILYYADCAMNIGFIPGVCIPFVHGICIKMICELNEIYGVSSSKKFAGDILAIALISTPMMVIPLLGACFASAYVQQSGEWYCETLEAVLKKSKYGDLKNQQLMAERIKNQLNKNKK